MEYFKYTLQFLNTITFTSSTYTELDNYLNGVVKGYLNHNFGFLPIAPTEDELDELADEIGASYDLMLNDIKPRYEEVLRLGTVHTFRSKDTTKSEYGAEDRTGKYYEPVVSSAQAEVKTNGENTTWGDDTTTLDREEDRVLSESAIKDFFKEIKEEVELYFIDFVNIYADGTGCQKPYTLEQLEAINSGITKTKLDQIIYLLDFLDTNKQNTLVGSQLDAVNSGINVGKVAQIEINRQKVNQLSKPNFLINSDFSINQRGQSAYTSDGNDYCADRWQILDNGGSFNISTKTYTSGSVDGKIIQRIEDYSKLLGQKVTLSCKVNTVDDNDCFYLYYEDTQEHVSELSFSNNAYMTLTFTVNALSSKLCVGVKSTKANKSISFAYFKLEYGNMPTPYIPETTDKELALCQRYYQKIVTGDTYRMLFIGTPYYSGVNVFVPYNFPVTMRAKPTLIWGGSLRAVPATNPAITSVEYDRISSYGATLKFVTSSVDLVNGQNYFIGASNDANAYVAFDAEMY